MRARVRRLPSTTKAVEVGVVEMTARKDRTSIGNDSNNKRAQGKAPTANRPAPSGWKLPAGAKGLTKVTPL